MAREREREREREGRWFPDVKWNSKRCKATPLLFLCAGIWTSLCASQWREWEMQRNHKTEEKEKALHCRRE